MEKESIGKFISQFNAITEASLLLKGTTDERKTEHFTKEIEYCCEIQENQNLLRDAITEIENNLYSFPKKKQRIAYVKDLLRSFVDIAPYFDDKTETVRSASNFKVGVKIVPGAKYTMQVVNGYCEGKEDKYNIDKYDNLPLEIKYVIECFISLHQFTPILDAKCLSFDIDLQDIQTEVGIYIQHRRQWDILSYCGFTQKEVSQIVKAEPKAITDQPEAKDKTPDHSLLLKALSNNENESEKYIIKSDDLIRQVYDICESAFDCDYLTFRKSIETANFHLLNIKKQNRVQDLTFRLSGIMDAEWYSDVCKIMNWKKGTCSGLGQKVENLSETKQLDKVLPRPKNR